MIIFQSIASLCLMIIFFSFLGLSVTNSNLIKRDFTLLPMLGFGTLITLAYLISANLKLSGADSVGYALIVLLLSIVVRYKDLISGLKALNKNQLIIFAVFIILPMVTLLIPAEINGFKYFFASVNYDFFYNSQDSWFLQQHNVLEYDIKNEIITPLTWSANYSGRVAVVLIGAFFSKFFALQALSFNSLLLNTLVILFSLSLGTLCLNFFNSSKRSAFIAVALCLLSAAYVQSYSYYIFGQISALPIFIVFCIYLKKFMDSIQSQESPAILRNYCLLLALILNILFFMYAILSVFAAVLAVLSYTLLFIMNHRNTPFLPLIKMLALAALFFCVARIFIIPESIVIFQSWITLSNTVAVARGHEMFIVFSEYLTEMNPAILLGLVNYPSSSSLISKWAPSDIIQINFLLFSGLIGSITTLLVFASFLRLKQYAQSSRVILVSLLLILIGLTGYFFFTLSGYGIFKLQTWFMPILLTVFIYYLIDVKITLLNSLLKIACVIIILMNLLSSYYYLRDYFVISNQQHFINAKNITGNKDILDLTDQIKKMQISQVSLMLNNGYDTAWFSDQLRSTNLTHVIHNAQTLNEKDLAKSPCGDENHEELTQLSPVVLMNFKREDYNEITPPPTGGNVLYENKEFILLDPAQLNTLAYIGTGSYPTEILAKKSSSFPSKFRWVEKGLEIYIYANKDKAVHFQVEVTPGYVTSPSIRNITIQHAHEQSHFKVLNKTDLSLSNVKLHKGLNCLLISSPDPVSFLPRYYAKMRSNIPLDPRLTNFAVSNIRIDEK
ncbi:MAG: hypothetical protein ACYC0J_00010 [Gammaproteobacteria bacterium]